MREFIRRLDLPRYWPYITWGLFIGTCLGLTIVLALVN